MRMQWNGRVQSSPDIGQGKTDDRRDDRGDTPSVPIRLSAVMEAICHIFIGNNEHNVSRMFTIETHE